MVGLETSKRGRQPAGASNKPVPNSVRRRTRNLYRKASTYTDSRYCTNPVLESEASAI